MDGSNQEFSKSQDSVKILHFPKTDILVPQETIGMSDFVNCFQEGLPPEFVEVSPEIFFDSKEQPTFVAKERIMTADDIHKKRYADRYQSISHESMNASNSLMNEFSLAREIQEVVDSESAQNFAKGLGYEGLRYVKPVLGIINKDNGHKYVIYPFIYGKQWYKSPPGMIVEEHEPVQPLIDLFEEKGINPEDLIPRQFRIGTDNWMYLLDTDQYHRKKDNYRF